MMSLTCLVRRQEMAETTYLLSDRLHPARTVRVPAEGIITTVSAWLAALGTYSPLVEDLARTVRSGDWPAAYAIADRLSVDVVVAA